MIKLYIHRFEDNELVVMKFKSEVDTSDFEKLTQINKYIEEAQKALSMSDSLKELQKVSEMINVIGKQLSEIASHKLSVGPEVLGEALSGYSNLKTSFIKDVYEYVYKLKDTFNELRGINPQLENTTTDVKLLTNSFGNLVPAVIEAKEELKETSEIADIDLRNAMSYIIQLFNRATYYTKSFVKKSNDYVESINLYTMAVGKYAEAGKEWAKQISDALYLDNSKVLQYAGSFYNLASGLGVSSEAANLMSKNLTQLTYDMTSYLNLGSADEAYTKLMSAMSGQTKAVTNVGIAVKEASLEETALSLGIKKSVSAMTESEKVQLRYIQIMKSTAQMQGDLARTAITPANAFRMLETQITLLGRAIGQMLTPMIINALPYLMALTEMATAAAKSLATLFGYNIADYEVSSTNNSMADFFKDIEKNADGARTSINRTLASFDDLNVVESSSSSNGGSNLPTIDFSSYLPQYDMLAEYMNQIQNNIGEAKEKLKTILPIATTIIGILTASAIIGKIAQVIENFEKGKKILTGAKGILSKIASMTGITKIGEALKNVIGLGDKSDKLEDAKKVLTSVDGVSKTANKLEVPKATTVLKALGDIGIILGATAAVVLVAGALSNIPGFNELMSGGIQQIADLFGLLGKIALPLLAFGAIAAGLGALQSVVYPGLLAIAVILGGTEILVAAFGALSLISEFDNFQSNGIAQIEKLFTLLQNMCKPLIEFGAVAAAIGALSGVILPGLVSIAAIIGGMELVVAAAAGLSKIPKFDEFMNGGYQLLIRLAEFIGEFFGTIISTFVDVSLDFLPSVGTKLSEFATNASGFFTSLEALPEGAGESAKNLGEAILAITKASILEGLLGWASGGSAVDKFTNSIPAFGEAMQKYSDSLTNFNPSAVEASINAAKCIAGIYDYLPPMNGIAQLWHGQQDLNGFSAALPEFGKNLSAYAENLGNINTSSVESSANAAKSLAEAVNSIPNTNGFWQVLSGGKDLLEFSYSLPSFGTNLSKYAKNLGDINPEVIESSANAAKSLAELANNLPNQGGVASWFSGDNKLSDFGAQVEWFGAYFNSYYWKIYDINQDKVNAITDAIVNIVNMFKDIKNNGLLDTMKNFGSSLESSGKSLSNYFKTALSTNEAMTIGSEFGKKLGSSIASAIKNTKMPTIELKDGNNNQIGKYTLKAYAAGGYVDSGDLFFANENGRAEFITSIGNKSAVANQDQMVSALAQAIKESVGNIGGNQHLTVQVGNKTLYEGQLEYNKQQSTKYGSTKFINV